MCKKIYTGGKLRGGYNWYPECQNEIETFGRYALKRSRKIDFASPLPYSDLHFRSFQDQRGNWRFIRATIVPRLKPYWGRTILWYSRLGNSEWTFNYIAIIIVFLYLHVHL